MSENATDSRAEVEDSGVLCWGHLCPKTWQGQHSCQICP